MALGKRNSCLKSRRVEEDGLNFGIVRYTRGLGRKRVVISCNEEASSPIELTPSKRRCGLNSTLDFESSSLEALPQEIMIRIICGVDHEDLKQLIRVSKSISEVTLIARQWHFAYSTPSKVRAFRTTLDYEDLSDFDEDAPNVPPVRRFRSPLNRKKLSELSVALFAEEEQWPKKKLLIEAEI